jgi:3',5'-cyclic AMP phosphodiesterase CpdA
MRIAHASDLHLYSMEGATLRRFLSKRLAGGANLLLRRGGHYRRELFQRILHEWRRDHFDHAVITGDVANLSLPAEFELARRILDEEGPPPHDLSLIPGNHDVYTRGAEKARRFDLAFQPFLTSDLDVAPAGDVYPYVRVRGRLAVIGLSSAIATAPIFASGEVRARQLEALETALLRPELERCFRLVLVHHPPAPPYSRVPLRGLRRAESLRRVLKRAGCELVLHGHEHLPLEHRIEGPGGRSIRVIGAASATHDDGEPAHAGRYNVYHLAEPEGLDRPVLERVETRIYDAASGTFVPGPGDGGESSRRSESAA